MLSKGSRSDSTLLELASQFRDLIVRDIERYVLAYGRHNSVPSQFEYMVMNFNGYGSSRFLVTCF